MNLQFIFHHDLFHRMQTEQFYLEIVKYHHNSAGHESKLNSFVDSIFFLIVKNYKFFKNTYTGIILSGVSFSHLITDSDYV